jgi:hypothetical protein
MADGIPISRTAHRVGAIRAAAPLYLAVRLLRIPDAVLLRRFIQASF